MLRSLTLLAAGLVGFSSAADTPSFLFILGDDIGWADFGYNNGTAHTPRVDAWTKRAGTVLFQDFHSGGTTCSPTRATVLTGRNHFRDCVANVDSCSDMTECVSAYEFAPQKTYTIGNAFTDALKQRQLAQKEASQKVGMVKDTKPSEKTSFFTGKWHLGSFYNDSEAYGGLTSSPITHGFDSFNATVEVSPTATTNCQCSQDWFDGCNFGHYDPLNLTNATTGHCAGGANPGGGDLLPGCCFNYWWEDDEADHGITNLTWPSPDDDSEYMSDSFSRFLDSREGEPFLAQISFHNCHIPFIGTARARQDCADGKTCRQPDAGAEPYTDTELDFYACMSELDAAIGRVLDALDDKGYGDDTMVWFTTDNGPEVNCHPEGFCGGTEHRPVPDTSEGPGSSGPLRGRKRDIWEGGHRVPGIISWPAFIKGPGRVSWKTVSTIDFLPTIMDILNVKRPKSQENWAMDGTSILPLLRDESTWADRGIGILHNTLDLDPVKGPYGYRYGDWKYVVGSTSCGEKWCLQPQLYNLKDDISERHDLAAQYPDILKAIEYNFTQWHASVLKSVADESQCKTIDDQVLHENFEQFDM